MQIRGILNLWLIFILFLSPFPSLITPPYSTSQITITQFSQSDAEDALKDAQEAIIRCFEAIHQADLIGVDVTELVDRGNDAIELLNQAKIYYTENNYTASIDTSSNAEQLANQVMNDAESLTNQTLNLKILQEFIQPFLIVGLVLFVLLLIFYAIRTESGKKHKKIMDAKITLKKEFLGEGNG